jgi:hypothetical protein
VVGSIQMKQTTTFRMSKGRAGVFKRIIGMGRVGNAVSWILSGGAKTWFGLGGKILWSWTRKVCRGREVQSLLRSHIYRHAWGRRFERLLYFVSMVLATLGTQQRTFQSQ